MISKEFKACLKLHRKLFFCLPEYIVKWHSNYNYLSINKSKLSWFVWLLFMFFSLITGIVHVYVVYHHYFVQPYPNFLLTHVFLYVATALAVGIVTTVATILIKNKD